MTEPARWLRLTVTLALIAAFVVTARGGWSGSGEDSAFAAQCELNPPREIDLLERCLALNPRDLEVMLDLGSLYQSSRRADRAEDIYRRALSIDAQDGDVHVRLGRLLLKRGDVAGAAVEARAALALQPNTVRAMELIADVEKAGDR